LSGLQAKEIGRLAITGRSVSFLVALVTPGNVAAGTNIPLPDYARPARSLLDALHLKAATATATHEACAASGAVYGTAEDLLSPSGEALITIARKLTIVTGPPLAGQIQLVDENNVKLGDDTREEDILLLIVERRA